MLRPVIITIVLSLSMGALCAQVNPDVLPVDSSDTGDWFFEPFVAPEVLNFDELQECLSHSSPTPDSGRAMVIVQVDSLGGYLSHEIIRGDAPELRRMLDGCIPLVRCLPGTYYGKPVQAQLLIPFKFEGPAKRE